MHLHRRERRAAGMVALRQAAEEDGQREQREIAELRRQQHQADPEGALELALKEERKAEKILTLGELRQVYIAAAERQGGNMPSRCRDLSIITLLAFGKVNLAEILRLGRSQLESFSLPKGGWGWVTRWMRFQGPGPHLAFTTLGGRKLDRKNVRRAIRRAGAEAGLENLGAEKLQKGEFWKIVDLERTSGRSYWGLRL